MVNGAWSRRAVLGMAGLAGTVAAAAALPARSAAAAQVTRVGVDRMPGAVAVNPVTGMAYVASETGTVTLVDTRRPARRATVGIGGTATDVAVDASAGRVYVTDEDAGTLSALDGATGRVLSTIATSPGAKAVGVDATTGTVYTGSGTDGSIAVVDSTSGTVTRVVTAEHGPLARASVDARRGTAYFSVPGWPGLAVFDLGGNTLTGHVKFGAAPDGVALHEESNVVYVANSAIHHLSVIEAGSGAERSQILLRSAASAVAVHQASATVYANGGPDGLVRIDGTTDEITGELALGSNPGGVAVDQRRGTVVVTDPVHHELVLVSGF